MKEIVNQGGLKAKIVYLEKKQRTDLEDFLIRQEKEILVVKEG